MATPKEIQDQALESRVDTVASSEPTVGPVETSTLENTIQTSQVPENFFSNRQELQKKILETGQQFSQGLQDFSEGDIVDRMRLKTGGVQDLDKQIESLRIDLNSSRPMLLEKYASVIDPTKRESLISQEENSIAKQVSDLQAIRKFRLGTIQDLTKAEIFDKQNKLKGLEAQYNLYRNVLGDLDKADKTKVDMEKTALDLQKQEIELKALRDKYGLELISRVEGQTSEELGQFESNVRQIGTGKITGYGSPKWKWGLDIDGEIGQDLRPMIGGEVIFTGDEGKGFGNQVKILDKQGNEIWYSHLDNVNVKETNQIQGDTVIGTIGATGDVIPGEGGDGSHVDITIKKPDGTFFTPEEVEKYIEGGQLGQPKLEKTGKSEAEKGGFLDINTVEDFLKNSGKITTPSKFKEKLSIQSVDAILKDNIGKWKLSSDSVDELLKNASDEANNAYIEADNIDYIKGLVENKNSQGVIDEVKGLIKDRYSKEQIIGLLQEAGILDDERKGIAEGFMENSFLYFDDDALDELQSLLDL